MFHENQWKNGANAWRPLPKMIFGCILVALWFPSGSPWLPFGCPWLSSGSLLVPFGALLLTIFSLWSPPASFFIFLWYFHKILIDIKDFPATSYQNTSFFCTRTCEATANDRVHPHLCKAHNYPRPGAGILPQATEIRFWSDLRFPGAPKTAP